MRIQLLCFYLFVFFYGSVLCNEAYGEDLIKGRILNDDDILVELDEPTRDHLTRIASRNMRKDVVLVASYMYLDLQNNPIVYACYFTSKDKEKPVECTYCFLINNLEFLESMESKPWHALYPYDSAIMGEYSKITKVYYFPISYPILELSRENITDENQYIEKSKIYDPEFKRFIPEEQFLDMQKDTIDLYDSIRNVQRNYEDEETEFVSEKIVLNTIHKVALH